MTRRLRLPVVLVACLATLTAACGATSPPTGGHLANGKAIILQAQINHHIGLMYAIGWADVPNGTPGELDVSGPISWRCQGTFVAHADGNRWQDLPWFMPAGFANNGPTPGSVYFRGIPLGEYTFTLRVPGREGGSLTRTVNGGLSGERLELPTGCDLTGSPSLPSSSGSPQIS
jgi:hypothetical protein